MTMRRKLLDIPGQRTLFDLLEAQAIQSPAPVEGSLNLRERLRGALNQALKSCPKSRWQVAGEMSHLLGTEITKWMIDAWTAESKEGHRFPAEYLPAFCRATGDAGPLRLLAEAAGLFALPGPEALRAEIQRLEEEARKLQAEKRKRLTFLEEMERRS